MLWYFNNYMTVLYQYALFIVALFFLDSIFFNTTYACLPVLHHSALHCSSWVWKSRTRQTMPLGNFNVQTRELRFSQWNRSNGLVWVKHAWSWPVAYPWTDAERYRRGLVSYTWSSMLSLWCCVSQSAAQSVTSHPDFHVSSIMATISGTGVDVFYSYFSSPD